MTVLCSIRICRITGNGSGFLTVRKACQPSIRLCAASWLEFAIATVLYEGVAACFCSEICKNRAGKCITAGKALPHCKASFTVCQAQDIHVSMAAAAFVGNNSMQGMSESCFRHFCFQALHSNGACRPGVALDHHLRPVIDNIETGLHVPGNSLNAVSRKHELDRISSDNQQILQRICNSKGAYSGAHASKLYSIHRLAVSSCCHCADADYIQLMATPIDASRHLRFGTHCCCK